MQVFCILSDKRAFASKSPDMFSRVMQSAGINGVYVPFQITPDRIAQAVDGLRTFQMAGANVTIPYKEAVIPYLDELSEGVNLIGAVNTITRRGNVLKGYNTNAIGFMNALEAVGFDVAGRPALVFGTGGAARAVIFMLKWLHADPLWIAGRNPDKTETIVRRIGGTARPFAGLAGQGLRADIVVNATSVSSPAESPELAELVAGLEISGCEMVVDLNYGRRRNVWRDLATARKALFLDGLPVLAQQARNSFALWTGIDVGVREFLKAIGHPPEFKPAKRP